MHKEWEELDPSWDTDIIQSTLESGLKADQEPKLVESDKPEAEIINTKNAEMKSDDSVTTHKPVEKDVENEESCKAQKKLKPSKFPTFGRTEYRTRARSRMVSQFVASAY